MGILMPFGTYDAPLGEGTKLWPQAPTYRPLTQNRMAYLLAFDVSSQESYLEALRIHKELTDYWQKKSFKLKPIIFLVANKIDKKATPGRSAAEDVETNATIWSEYNSVRYYPVSAMQSKGIKKLFRSAVEAVRQNTPLWSIDLRSTDGGIGDMAKSMTSCRQS